jgi:hypothetical protein
MIGDVHATTTTTTTTTPWPQRRTVGPVGTAARIAVGIGFVSLALLWNDPNWADVAVGLVVLPAVAVGLLGWRARRNPGRLDATGPVAHCVNAAVFTPLFLIPATSGGAFLFYGSSMLVAAARRSGGCEVTEIANVALGRDDQVGCVLFGPIDAVEAGRR